MRDDERLVESEPFSAIGTWIEYVNRVVGFISGNLMLLLFIASLFVWRMDKGLAIRAFIALIAIGFQAWLGAVVVATSLTPWVITVHMMVAFFIIALLISIYNKTKGGSFKWKQYRPLIVLALLLTLLQVVFGTQVRQEIDHLGDLGIARVNWIAQLSETLRTPSQFFHSSFTGQWLLGLSLLEYTNLAPIGRYSHIGESL